MQVKFVNYSEQYRKIKKEIDFAIQDCFKRGNLILRQDIEKFEDNLALYVDSYYAIGLNSGTDAILLALKTLGIGKGDEVITSGYTFWATVEAIYHSGAKPKLADIKKDLTLDPQSVKKLITKKTKAIIPIYIGGTSYDVQAIKKLARIYKLKVIEDAAQGLGCIHSGRIGEISCFSFYPAKVLGAYGDAGAITTNKKWIFEKVIRLRNHGGKPYPKFIGYNSRLDNIQAAILNTKIKYLDSWIARRREIANIYFEELNDLTSIKKVLLPHSETFQEYNIRIYDNKRNKLADFLKEKGIETILGDYTFPHPDQKNLPETVKANQEILRLPIWPDLSNKEIGYVCKCIKEFYEK